MKILRSLLLFVGFLLLSFGLWKLFFPDYTKIVNDSSNQIVGILGLGILAIIASIFAKNRR